jgi:TetR/AcrR family transcriptional regulator, cholesterol catabolism regulator
LHEQGTCQLKKSEMMSVAEPVLPQPETESQRRRRTRVLDAVISLIEEGEGNLDIKAVAERSDVALGTIYRYFSSREVLFAEAYLTLRARQAGDFDKVAKATGDRKKRCLALFEKIIELHSKQPQLWEIATIARSSRHPDIVALRRSTEARTHQLMGEIVGPMPDTELKTIIAILDSVYLAQMAFWHSGDISLGEVLKLLNRTIRILLK